MDFPVDDITLEAIEHALQGVWHLEDDGTHTLVGAEYSFHNLMNFLSGYDPTKEVLISDDDSTVETYVYEGGTIYGYQDVIKALVNEVKRLRKLIDDG